MRFKTLEFQIISNPCVVSIGNYRAIMSTGVAGNVTSLPISELQKNWNAKKISTKPITVEGRYGLPITGDLYALYDFRIKDSLGNSVVLPKLVVMPLDTDAMEAEFMFGSELICKYGLQFSYPRISIGFEGSFELNLP